VIRRWARHRCAPALRRSTWASSIRIPNWAEPTRSIRRSLLACHTLQAGRICAKAWAGLGPILFSLFPLFPYFVIRLNIPEISSASKIRRQLYKLHKKSTLIFLESL
jgi:hypothetical protein